MNPLATAAGLPQQRGDFFAGFWRLADPKISLASMASMLLGACAAALDGPLAPGWLALTVAGIFFLEVAKNASGEVVDWDSGTDQAVAPEDRSPFSGGKLDFMVRGDRVLTIPNPHKADIGPELLAIVLRQAGITRKQWERV